MVVEKLAKVQFAIESKQYVKAIQFLHEAGVMMLAVGVAIQKVMARD